LPAYTAAISREGRSLPHALRAALGFGFAGLRGYAWFGLHREKTAPPQELRVVKPELAPSTYANTNMVEEVVREVNDSASKLRETGMLGLPYEQLSFAEKNQL